MKGCAFMYELIKKLCIEKGISPTKLCTEITGSKGNLPTWQKGNINPKSLIKIADYFSVSVDYLLGRTDEPKATGGHSIKIEDIHGDHSANVNIGENIDNETLEIAQIIKKLSIVQRAEIILKVNEMINQNKEKK